MLWSGLWGPCLFCLRLGRVFLSSLQVCCFFFPMWMSRSGYTVTPRGRCVTPSLLPAMCVCGVGLSSVQGPPSHHPSSLAPPPPVGLCTVLLCGSVVCFVPPPPKFCNPPPPPCALVPGLLVGWLLVFWLLGCLLRWLVGCWLIGSRTAEFGWLLGWLVGWLVGLVR